MTMTGIKAFIAVVIVLITGLALGNGIITVPIAWIVIIGLFLWNLSIPHRI